ncbi:MAG: Lrp/AsnC family transcriptional regulator [Clostridiales bacterium]|jgi:DNA-binding Lrp family transcriptional regulator|nr:Lrp/AsnC family transcriptional regulator [Clostridiales bacterium]
MDEIKLKILDVLREDARTPVEAIAKMLGLAVTEAAGLIDELESGGVIAKYTTVVDEERTGAERVNALIEVKVSPVKSRGFDEIARYICQFSEVKSVYLMSGAYDLAVFIEGRSLKEVARFVSEKLSAVDKVLSTATHFILKKYKLEGVEFGSEAGSRLIVHP